MLCKFKKRKERMCRILIRFLRGWLGCCVWVASVSAQEEARKQDSAPTESTPQHSGAASAANGTQKITLGETEVVAEALHEKERLNSPVPQAGVVRDEFAPRNNRRAGDVIQRLPGLYIGPPGERKDVRLRGLDKEFTRPEFNGV